MEILKFALKFLLLLQAIDLLGACGQAGQAGKVPTTETTNALIIQIPGVSSAQVKISVLPVDWVEGISVVDTDPQGLVNGFRWEGKLTETDILVRNMRAGNYLVYVQLQDSLVAITGHVVENSLPDTLQLENFYASAQVSLPGIQRELRIAGLPLLSRVEEGNTIIAQLPPGELRLLKLSQDLTFVDSVAKIFMVPRAIVEQVDFMQFISLNSIITTVWQRQGQLILPLGSPGFALAHRLENVDLPLALPQETDFSAFRRDGLDIVFLDSRAGVIPHKLVQFNSTAQRAVYRLQISSLEPMEDFTVHYFFGNPDSTTQIPIRHNSWVWELDGNLQEIDGKTSPPAQVGWINSESWQGGVMGSALHMGNTGDEVLISEDFSLDSLLTMGCWFRPEGSLWLSNLVAGLDHELRLTWGSGEGEGLPKAQTLLYTKKNDGTDSVLVIQTDLMDTNVWHYAVVRVQIAAEYSFLDFFVNGELVDYMEIVGLQSSLINNSGLRIGGQYADYSAQFRGLIDEISVYRGIMEPERIRLHWWLGNALLNAN